MATPRDIASAQRIADWNTRHGATGLTAVTSAQGGLEVALADMDDSPGAANQIRLNTAGATLAAAAQRALDLPHVGVPKFDEPYREGLACYVQAGIAVSTWRVSSDEEDVPLRAANLLIEGRAITARATQYTKALLARVTG